MARYSLFGITLLASILLSACNLAAGGLPSSPQKSPTLELRKAATPPLSKDASALPAPVIYLPAESPPAGAEAEFSTDFSKHTVPYAEILSGGPPKDGIPAIDRPVFVEVTEADRWLDPVEPVILVEVTGEARAYPLQILAWHEIVNDSLGGLPLAVTFCPLCNTAIAFERTFNGQVLDFGTTGRLRYSNLILYDRQTETWWQQAGGEAIVGHYAGQQLDFHPAVIISWQEFKTAYSDGEVLSRDTGFTRPYGENPYAGYDDVNNPPFLYDGPPTPGVLPPMARVITLNLSDEAVAYPYEALQALQVVNDTVAGQPVAVFWVAGTASALDSALIAQGRDVGSAAAYSRLIDGQALEFEFRDGQIIDQHTGSVWNVLGQAVSGELAGRQLSPLVAINHFWFSWAAFKPETRLYQP
ncbi:MAG: DUF3179 domain-containing protein [Anaerolineales bacterium]|jgi:hypothetical protein|nr:DUF3179 domain-containing protein [Anaerolineales bacterium]